MLTTVLLPVLLAVLVEPQPLAGTWQLTHVEQDATVGKGDPSCFIIIRANAFTIYKDGEPAMSGELTVDRRGGTLDFS
jgi:hypothetical protein